MIRGLIDGFRRGRDEAVAGYRRPSYAEPPPDEADEPAEYGGEPQRPADDLASERRACGADRDEKARLLAEVTEYAEQLQARVAELEAAAQPLVKTLRLPGLKAMLLNRFHPDKHPDADPDMRAHLTDAIKTINDAYAVADGLDVSRNGRSPS